MSTILAIADAIAQVLNSAPAGSFTLAITAVREVLPEFDLAQLAQPRVSVVPKAIETTGATRALVQFDYQVDIGVQQKLTDPQTQVPQLCSLVEQIGNYLRRRPLPQVPGLAWVSQQMDPIYAPPHLAEQRVFTSVLTLTYRGMAA